VDEWSDERGQNKNEYIRGSIGVASIVEKLCENMLRWLRHVLRREKTEAVQ